MKISASVAGVAVEISQAVSAPHVAMLVPTAGAHFSKILADTAIRFECLAGYPGHTQTLVPEKILTKLFRQPSPSVFSVGWGTGSICVLAWPAGADGGGVGVGG